MTWAILDLETTGLMPWPAHEPWEATLIIPGPNRREITWQLPVDLGRADAAALRINHFHERRWPTAATESDRRSAVAGIDTAPGQHFNGSRCVVHPDDMGLWAAEFARLTRPGVALVGANVGFDMKDHLDGLLRAHGACPEYHHRPVCSEAALWGYVNGRLTADPALADKIDVTVLDLPWSHGKLLDAAMTLTGASLTISDTERHTALGDCLLVEKVYAEITGWSA